VKASNLTTVILSQKKYLLGTFRGWAAMTAQMNRVTTWDGTLYKLF
jgi:hypothetical protein